MTAVTISVIAGGTAIVSTMIASWQATKGLTANRQLDSTRQFLELVAVAHGRPVDGRSSVGVSEMVAAVHLIAEFGATMPWLGPSARETLSDLDWHEHESVKRALALAKERLADV